MIEDVSSHELLIQLKHGDDEAVPILYARYAKEFYQMARRQGLTHQDAEDVVHIVFYRTISHIASYDEAFGGGEKWMRIICKHAVADVFRQRPIEQLPADCPASENIEPEKWVEKKEHLQKINIVWESISETDRQELRRGRGRGPGRKKWHEAIQRFRDIWDSL